MIAEVIFEKRRHGTENLKRSQGNVWLVDILASEHNYRLITTIYEIASNEISMPFAAANGHLLEVSHLCA